MPSTGQGCTNGHHRGRSAEPVAPTARAVHDGRVAKPHLEIGICGEHGGEPDSVALFHELGLDYVSCSPFRVQGACLAAAHAALAGDHNGERRGGQPVGRALLVVPDEEPIRTP